MDPVFFEYAKFLLCLVCLEQGLQNVTRCIGILSPGVTSSMEANFKAVSGSQPWLAL